MNLPEFITKDFYPWNYPSDKLVQLLKTNVNHGLTNEEALARIALFGDNTLEESSEVKWYSLLLKQFINPVIFTLIAATILSIILGDWIDALAILLIIFFNALIGFLQEFKATNALIALKKLSKPKCRVIRNNILEEIKTEQVTIGDIIFLEGGDIVPADARIIFSNQLKVNESNLTGESLPIKKLDTILPIETTIPDRKNMLFASTTISSGTVRAIVTGISELSEIVKIAGLIKGQPNEPTPLEKKIKDVSNKLLITGLFVVTLIAVIGILKNHYWYDVILVAISLAIASIPEGLPAIVTIAEALAVRRLVKKNAIIRHLPAVETLGVTNTILTDKTGTLTIGKMEVIDIEKDSEQLLEVAQFCNNATLTNGDPIEVALNQYIQKCGFKSKINGARIKEWAFDSVRKKMSVAILDSNNKSVVRIFTKGAPEVLMQNCNLSDTERVELEKTIEKYSLEAKKILMFAQKSLPENAFSKEMDYFEIEKDLEFLGLVTFSDPPKPESFNSIKKCYEANINVVMVTGDHPIYAKQIARTLGIIHDPTKDKVLTGDDLVKISLEDLKKELPSIKVFARVTPEDKLTIVKLWKELGHVVAMTGDGVNDAPALKAATIGISMGKRGTEVAKASSDMVLADDNFATIVAAIEEGRHIYGNIKRTIFYLLTGNLTEILVILVAISLNLPFPLFPLQLLWINLITDGLPALALVAEPLPANILKESSRPNPKTFFTSSIIENTFFIAIINTIMFVAIYIITLKMYGEKLAQTYIFILFVCEELLRSFASRSEYKSILKLGLNSNLWHFFSVLIPLLLQFTINRSTVLREVFRVVRISDLEFIVLILFALIPLLIIELKKKIVRVR
ncbi:MAG: cation-translocating P-type ATPase [Bacteriovoracaceae bacterium]